MAKDKKKGLYPDSDTEATFKKMQDKIDEPECFGKHNSGENDQCWQCWYHPNCKAKSK